MDYHWGQLHSDFITTLLSEFSQNNIRYFILRNYEELPQKNNGKDVDIVIEPGKYKAAKKAIIKVLKINDIEYYTITQFDRMRCWYIMDIKKQFGIHIDIIENEVYKGFEFFSFECLYNHTVIYNNITVLNKTADTLMLLVQNLVAYKSLKDKYRKTIEDNYASCKIDLDAAIIAFWGDRVGAFLIQKLELSDFETIVDNARLFEKTAMKRIFLKRPFYTAGNVLRFILGKCYSIIWCPRKIWRFIAVEAPDGTGKSTFIDALVLKLRMYYVSDSERFCIHHFRPGILPNLGEAGERVGVMKQDKDFTNPHRAKPVGFLSSLIRMIYYWLDYVIGMPYLIRREAQYGQYTIFDRYVYDFLVDPARSRIKLPKWVRILFVRLVIKPQIIFVLEADADVIYQRKQELTREEIKRQLKDFRSIKSLGKRVVFINANHSVEEMVGCAERSLMEKFMNKATD